MPLVPQPKQSPEWAETRMGFLWPGVDGNLSWATFLRGTSPGPWHLAVSVVIILYWPLTPIIPTMTCLPWHNHMSGSMTLHDTLQHQSWLIIRANVYLELMMLWAELRDWKWNFVKISRLVKLNQIWPGRKAGTTAPVAFWIQKSFLWTFQEVGGGHWNINQTEHIIVTASHIPQYFRRRVRSD